MLNYVKMNTYLGFANTRFYLKFKNAIRIKFQNK